MKTNDNQNNIVRSSKSHKVITRKLRTTTAKVVELKKLEVVEATGHHLLV